jgi:DNA-directed RNA polymerase specialized sigma24 family protein
VFALPATLQEMYRLRTSGLSYEEMAEVLEIPLGTIKSRMHHMVRVLQEELRPWTAP